MKHLHKALCKMPVGGLLVLLGCAGGGDPSSDNLFTGIANLSRGEYQRRVDERREALEQVEAERDDLRQAKAESEEEQNARRSERESAERKLADIGISLDALEQKLSDAGISQELEQSALLELQQEVENLATQQTLLETDPGLDEEAKLEQIKNLEERKAILENAIEQAIDQ